MDRLRRRDTESDAESTGSLEEGELLDDRELSTATPTSEQPISGRTNANLWKEVVLDQNLEQITSGARVEGNLFDRGSESYAVPVDEDFEEIDRVKKEELKTTKVHGGNTQRNVFLNDCCLVLDCQTLAEGRR